MIVMSIASLSLELLHFKGVSNKVGDLIGEGSNVLVPYFLGGGRGAHVALHTGHPSPLQTVINGWPQKDGKAGTPDLSCSSKQWFGTL